MEEVSGNLQTKRGKYEEDGKDPFAKFRSRRSGVNRLRIFVQIRINLRNNVRVVSLNSQSKKKKRN